MGVSNTALISDQVLMRVPVAGRTFKYLKWNTAQNFTVPNTRVGRKSKPNQVEFNATETEGSVEDFGLADGVPNSDIEEGRVSGMDPVANAVQGLSHLVQLDREVRVAGTVFNTANYPAANQVTLSGTDQWDDTSSDPIAQIMDGLNTPLMRPNTMVIGQAAYSKLVQHPKIVSAALGNSGTSGVATREQLARLFELDRVLVGQGFLNSAKKGQSASYSRVWGGNCALLHLNTQMTSVKDVRPTWGFTAELRSGRVAGALPDKDIGMSGGQDVRVGEAVRELVTYTELGYYLEACV
jgi:hypothetical protein